MRGTGRLTDLYQKCHDQVQFIVTNIREAHPVDGWWYGIGWMSQLMRLGGFRAATNVYDARTIAERRQVAAECAQELKVDIHTFVDEMDDAVNQAYAAWPTRLYLIGLDGRIVYHGVSGPFDFFRRKLGRAIETYRNGELSKIRSLNHN